MGTRALDLITIWNALVRLERKVIDETQANSVEWMTKGGGLSPESEFVVRWLTEKNRKILAKVKDINVEISFDAKRLNKMIESAGFSENIENLGQNELGFASILDKIARWTDVAEKRTIQTKKGQKPGFELDDDKVTIYQVEGYKDSILISPATRTKNKIWFFLHDDQNLEGIEMVKLSFDVMGRRRLWHPRYEGARIPKLDFVVKPNIKWLTDLMLYPDTKNIEDSFFLNKVEQTFKMRMDETGARVKVLTFGSGLIGAAIHKVTLIIDRPFYGWWTQDNLENLPMAVFYADFDCWKEPEGSLEDL